MASMAVWRMGCSRPQRPSEAGGSWWEDGAAGPPPPLLQGCPWGSLGVWWHGRGGPGGHAKGLGRAGRLSDLWLLLLCLPVLLQLLQACRGSFVMGAFDIPRIKRAGKHVISYVMTAWVSTSMRARGRGEAASECPGLWCG